MADRSHNYRITISTFLLLLFVSLKRNAPAPQSYCTNFAARPSNFYGFSEYEGHKLV